MTNIDVSEMTDDLDRADRKVDSIVIGLAKGNTNNAIDGLFGNPTYCAYLLTKTSELSFDVKDIEIDKAHINWNPEYVLATSKKDIRALLDSKIEVGIKEEGFISPFSEGFNPNKDFPAPAIDIDANKYLNSENLDLSKNTVMERFMIAMACCNKVAQELDAILHEAPKLPTNKCLAVEVNNLANKLMNVLEKVEMQSASLAITSQIGLSRVVNSAIDENERMYKLLDEMASKIAG